MEGPQGEIAISRLLHPIALLVLKPPDFRTLKGRVDLKFSSPSTIIKKYFPVAHKKLEKNDIEIF